MANIVEDKIYRLKFKLVTAGGTFTAPSGTVIQGVGIVGVSASYKGKSAIAGDDHATTGVYASGSALEMFASEPCAYSEISVTAGTVKAYYGAL